MPSLDRGQDPVLEPEVMDCLPEQAFRDQYYKTLFVTTDGSVNWKSLLWKASRGCNLFTWIVKMCQVQTHEVLKIFCCYCAEINRFITKEWQKKFNCIGARMNMIKFTSLLRPWGRRGLHQGNVDLWRLLIEKVSARLYMLRWNNPLWLSVANNVNSFYQSKCYISAKQWYSKICLRHQT